MHEPVWVYEAADQIARGAFRILMKTRTRMYDLSLRGTGWYILHSDPRAMALNLTAQSHNWDRRLFDTEG